MLGIGWPTSSEACQAASRCRSSSSRSAIGLGVVDRQFLVGDVVHPRAHDLADELAAGLAADGLGDHADRVLRLDEAEWHR